MGLDIRMPIGWLFLVYGVLLIGYGALSDQAIYAALPGRQHQRRLGSRHAAVRRRHVGPGRGAAAKTTRPPGKASSSPPASSFLSERERPEGRRGCRDCSPDWPTIRSERRPVTRPQNWKPRPRAPRFWLRPAKTFRPNPAPDRLGRRGHTPNVNRQSSLHQHVIGEPGREA